MKKIIMTILLVLVTLQLINCKKRTQPLTNVDFSKKYFSVSPIAKVYFSPGNLQYQASTDTWRFAENQWDIIGAANANISPYYNGWIDLFGWGTGNNPTSINHYPPHLVGFIDWGNNISDSGGNTWWTLTLNNWSYVLYERETPSGARFAPAKVNGICGIILLPDNWNTDTYMLNNINQGYGSFENDIISAAVWESVFEKNGAVFLPVAGYREYQHVYYYNVEGCYWSSTISTNTVGRLWFSNTSLGTGVIGTTYTHYGYSVRLVRNATE